MITNLTLFTTFPPGIWNYLENDNDIVQDLMALYKNMRHMKIGNIPDTQKYNTVLFWKYIGLF